ncbi:MAG: SH3 domain-containing protein [Rhizobiales bacterium]|nr:SH3 domain-containing protein [Hyphomicrobiales bacterium]
MKHSVKFAERDETPEYLGKPQRSARGDAGNPFAAARPASAEEPPAAPPEPGRTIDIEDLVSELEAALMADLDHVATMMQSEPADELRPAPFHVETPAEPEDEETLDGEALQRLMASIRQPVPKPQPEEAAVEEDRPPLRPSAPLVMAADAAPRGSRSGQRRAERGRRVQSSLIVGATLVALAGGGAFMTVQSVTAHDDPGPERVASLASAPDRKAATAVSDTATASPAVAKTEERAAPAPAAEATPKRAAADPGARDAALVAAASDTGAANPGTAALAKSDLLFAPPAAEPAPPPAVADAPLAQDGAPANEAPPQKLVLAEPEPAPAALKAGAPKTGDARITSGVKLRSNPDNGAPVIGLLKAGENVTIVACKGWCEVVAGDKRGFVFQKFLAKGG